MKKKLLIIRDWIWVVVGDVFFSAFACFVFFFFFGDWHFATLFLITWFESFPGPTSIESTQESNLGLPRPPMPRIAGRSGIPPDTKWTNRKSQCPDPNLRAERRFFFRFYRLAFFYNAPAAKVNDTGHVDNRDELVLVFSSIDNGLFVLFQVDGNRVDLVVFFFTKFSWILLCFTDSTVIQ